MDNLSVSMSAERWQGLVNILVEQPIPVSWRELNGFIQDISAQLQKQAQAIQQQQGEAQPGPRLVTDEAS